MDDDFQRRDTADESFLRSFLLNVGDWADFSLQTLLGIFLGFRLILKSSAIYYEIGVRSAGVVVITGLFIGMVLSLQAYNQFHSYGLETSLGAVSITTILSELGPVLAAVMLAGRIGGSMAAEIGTMRITEQTEALTCLGVNPIYYLSTPRFIGCLFLIPLLTVFADIAGIAGSSLVSTQLLGVDAHHYWEQILRSVRRWDIFVGLIKSMVFGGLIALVSCHRGFRCQAGAQGVGRAATQSFVVSFLVILLFDFLLVYFFGTLRRHVLG